MRQVYFCPHGSARGSLNFVVGYPNCAILTGANFQSVFYRQLWASNAKLLNYYMFYGGTSWGGIPFP